MSNDNDKFNGITVSGKSMEEYLIGEEYQRTIKVRDKEIQVMTKNKRKRGKPHLPYRENQCIGGADRKAGQLRYLSKKEIEEAIMNKQIIPLSYTKGLNGQEAIYEAFKAHDFMPMRSAQIARACKKSVNNVYSMVSTMQANGMLVREEKEPRKFFYSVPEAMRGVGRSTWSNMFRDAANKVRQKMKATKEEEKKEPEVKKKEPPASAAPSFDEDTKVADRVREALVDLNEAFKAMNDRGLKVGFRSTDEGQLVIPLEVKIVREF